MQFVQVDAAGRPEPLPGDIEEQSAELPAPWDALRDRAAKLLAIRS